MTTVMVVVSYLEEVRPDAPEVIVHACRTALDQERIDYFQNIVKLALIERANASVEPLPPELEWSMLLQVIGMAAMMTFQETLPGKYEMIRVVSTEGLFVGAAITMQDRSIPKEILIRYEGEILHKPALSRTMH